MSKDDWFVLVYGLVVSCVFGWLGLVVLSNK